MAQTLQEPRCWVRSLSPCPPLPFPGHSLPSGAQILHPPPALLPCPGGVTTPGSRTIPMTQTRGAGCPCLLSTPHGWGMLSLAGHLHCQCCSLIFLRAIIRGLKSSSLAVSFMCQLHSFHLLVFVSLFPVLTHLPKAGSSWAVPLGSFAAAAAAPPSPACGSKAAPCQGRQAQSGAVREQGLHSVKATHSSHQLQHGWN